VLKNAARNWIGELGAADFVSAEMRSLKIGYECIVTHSEGNVRLNIKKS
jgi:hypothetical protein